MIKETPDIIPVVLLQTYCHPSADSFSGAINYGGGWRIFSSLVGALTWCQPQRVISGLTPNLGLSPSYL